MNGFFHTLSATLFKERNHRAELYEITFPRLNLFQHTAIRRFDLDVDLIGLNLSPRLL